MAKSKIESVEVFNEKAKPYKDKIDQVFKKEKEILDLMKKDSLGKAYKKLLLAEDMMYVVTLYLAINNLSVEVKGSKHTDSLEQGRKALYKSLIYLEEIVSDKIDVPYSEYEELVNEISNTPMQKRYYIVRKLGLAIRLIMDAYGENTKWKWAFVELQGRFATVAKNMVNLKEAVKAYFDPRHPDYELTLYYMRMIKKLLWQSADKYRDRYELSTHRIDDFRMGINFLLADRRICVLLNEKSEAEEIKKKALVWRDKMEADQKEQEKQR